MTANVFSFRDQARSSKIKQIKKVLLLETVLHELTKHSEVSLDAVPEKNEIRQEAIDKYTKGDLPQPKTPDEFWSGSNFKTFYQYLVQGIKPQTKFPNTRKTTSELQTLYNQYNPTYGDTNVTLEIE